MSHLKAEGVHEVPARELLDRSGRVKQVLMADDAVPLEASLVARVLLKEGEAHARIALHAVEEVNAQALEAAAGGIRANARQAGGYQSA